MAYDGSFGGLTDASKFWRAAIESSGDLVYEWNLASDDLEFGGAATDFFGQDESAIPQTSDSYNALIHPEDQPRRLHALNRHFASATEYDCEYRIVGERGSEHWVHDRGAVEFGPDGKPVCLRGLLRKVTQRKENEARLERLANFDDLTGRASMMRLQTVLDQALVDSLRHQRQGCFMVLGVDAMDRINSAFGTNVGDSVLREVGQRLEGCLRPTDTVGRLGGDRFGLVLSDYTPGEAQQVGETILARLRELAINTKSGAIHTTASLGLVFFPEQTTSSVDATAKAEGAMANAKILGRDCVSVCQISEKSREGFRASMAMGEAVKLALDDQRLMLAYQPVVNAHSREILYYECLIRMRDESGELVPAGRFIPAVENLGLMRVIDNRVLELTLEALDRYPGIKLAMNISGHTASDRSWLRTLVKALRGKPDMASRLIVEITETTALHDLDDTARFVNAVRNLGCQVAIDDFGAGYTTFRHFKSFHVDIVKIDGAFVGSIMESQENQLFIRNLLSLAHAYSMQTVAECVEQDDEANFLAAEGVDLLQGYFFGRPELEPKGWQAKEEPVDVESRVVQLQISKSSGH
ncbi:putative bifunctional diguanylate cyclase/phosphodiesterase [Rhodovibrionaceae bacterium A322]